MSELKDDKPSPGSDDAVENHCICPINNSYDDILYIKKECPIHGSKGMEK